MGTGVDADDVSRAAPAFRHGRLAFALPLLLAAGVVVAIVLTNRSPSPAAAGNASGATGSATVQRRNLIETDTESGTLSYAGSHTVYNRLSGTVTWLPAVGQLIKPGYVLYRVDNQPVLLFDGITPAYRDLKSSDGAGPDILELNTDLVQLGYDPDEIVIDDDWQAATTAGVKALQATWGETQSGELKLGSVVFLPGPQLVSTVDGTVGSGVSLVNPPSQTEFVSLTETTPANIHPKSGKRAKHKRKSRPPSQEQQLQALLALLRAETTQLRGQRSGGSGSSNGHSSGSSLGSKSSGSRSSGPSSGAGSAGGSDATEVLQTTSDHLIVTVDLPATSQSEATVGATVLVEMPAGDTVNGRITAVSPVATNSGGNGNNPNGSNNSGGGSNNNSGNGSSGSSATVPVTIALTRPVQGTGLDQAAVSVEFAQAKATNVLSVPVTALLATAGSRYAVQESVPPHQLIPVRTGLFAAGYVQISGPGIYPGLQITDSQG